MDPTGPCAASGFVVFLDIITHVRSDDAEDPVPVNETDRSLAALVGKRIGRPTEFTVSTQDWEW